MSALRKQGAEPVLELQNLVVEFETADGIVQAVNGIDLSVAGGECVGIVGESGSGKTQALLACMGLLASNGRARGAVRYAGQELLGLDVDALNRIRGDGLSMIFQDPLTSLTPHLKIGRQLEEVLIVHKNIHGDDASRRAIEMLDQVRVPDAPNRLRQYPHELSGGLRQRVMIAMALLCQPKVLIADEPTTALDVTVQADLLDLLASLKADTGMSIVLITHDLGVIAGLADRVAVMYAGQLVEVTSARRLFSDPGHPYSRGLLDSTPSLDDAIDAAEVWIPGQPPDPTAERSGCPFAPRCSYRHARCDEDNPALGPWRASVEGVRACHLDAEQAP
jgi:oligopeptide transport system ATP-binding protein